MRADAEQLGALLESLVRNAAEAIETQPGQVEIEGGVLRADLSLLAAAQGGADLAEGDYVYLRVRDNGCGMDADTRARLFEPFFSTRFAGRGMGMASVLGIARGHGGCVHVETEAGRGTTVTVLLPPTAC